MKNRSTLTNLCVYLEDISEAVNKGMNVDAIYTDFSRAFDVVNFNLLIKKLNCYGVKGNLLRWTESFLKGRSQYVKMNDVISSYSCSLGSWARYPP